LDICQYHMLVKPGKQIKIDKPEGSVFIHIKFKISTKFRDGIVLNHTDKDTPIFLCETNFIINKPVSLYIGIS